MEFTNKSDIPEMEARVLSVLKTCYDPEIPVDIYELGLIYGVEVDEARNVRVLMTLTSPNCPAVESLPATVEERLASIKDVASAMVDIVFEPPWTKDMMSEVALLELGFM